MTRRKPRTHATETKDRAPWRIWHPNGTYYHGRTGIGPRFGSPRGEAAMFATAKEAFAVTLSHPFAFVGCMLEDCDGNRRDDP